MSGNALLDQKEQQQTKGDGITLKNPPKLQKIITTILKHRDRIVAEMPRGIDGGLVIRKAITAVRKKPDLLNADPASLFHAISESVANGIEIGGVRDLSYLVRYGKAIQWQLGYKGMIELVRRTGEVANISMETVHEGDEFDYALGDSPRINHVPSDDSKRHEKVMTHCYVVVELKDGTKVRNVWTASQIHAHKSQYSKAYQKAEAYIAIQNKKKESIDPEKLSPWHTNERVMAIKTVLRDMFSRGRLPISESIQDNINREIQLEQGKAVEIPGTDGLSKLLNASDPAELPAIEDNTTEADGNELPEDVDAYSSCLEELGAAKTVAECSAIREKWLPFAKDEAEQADIDIAASEAQTALRSKEQSKEATK